jgi:signal transduction histidine kinase/ActR/RegA family two-component response regulator
MDVGRVSVTSLLSAFAAGVHLCIGVVLLLLSRAPGWARVRRFIPVTLAAASYAAINLVVYREGVSLPVVRALTPASLVIAAAGMVAWCVYTWSVVDQPWWRLPTAVRWLIGAVVLASVIAAQPSVGVADRATAPEQAHNGLNELGASLISVLVVCAVAVAVTHIRRGRRLRLRLYPLGFLVYLITVAHEAVMSVGLSPLPTLVDLGGVACGLGVVAMSVAQVVREANSMARSTDHLADAVRTRTHELDEAREAVLESARLAALGRLAAGVGHEINNPLMYVRLSLDLIRDNLADGERPASPADVRQAVEDALEGTERIARVVADLRTSARVESEAREVIDPREAVAAALRITGHRLRGAVELVEDLGAVPKVSADPQRLGQVFINLIINAVQAIAATPGGHGRLVLRSRTTAAGAACLEVIDSGPGMSDAVLPRVAEPYFTTRTGDGGLGLGLFISRGIITSHGGRLDFESAVGAGTTARITLPAATRSRSAAQPAVAEPRPLAILRRALIVDDEPLVARALIRQLRGSEVTVCNTGVEALEVLARDDQFDVILCDLIMPRMSGIELEAVVAERHPGLRRRMLFLTGGATVPSAERFLERPDVRWMSKPISRDALIAAIQQVLDDARLREAG